LSARSILDRPGRQASARWSPDGRFIAYESTESGSHQIFVRELEGARRQWQVTGEGGIQPQWRSDGRELFFVSGPGLSAVDVVWKDHMPSFGSPHAVLRVNIGPFLRNSYVPTPDGQRFLVVEREPEPDAPLTVVLNWHP
jgi:dipeptidyl aminopeptidase/acylaminoacyl peptidase